MAARWNSSRAPESPLSRMRSKPWWVFRCANLISTRFLSSRDLANAIAHRAPMNRPGTEDDRARDGSQCGNRVASVRAGDKALNPLT